MSQRRRYLLITVLLGLFAIDPLLAPGYFSKAHDGLHSAFFLYEFDRAISDGVLVPRWGPDHAFGYGYPTFVFYSPLAYYVGETFHLAGTGIVTAVKLTYALSILLSGVGTFALAEGLAGPIAGCLAAVLYMYAPYRFVDIYVRSALSESFAIALFPWALWAFWRLVSNPGRSRAVVAALVYAALLLSHNITALLFSPLLVLFIILQLWQQGRLRQKSTWGWCLAAGGLSVGLAMFSLLPMVLEVPNISQGQFTGGRYSLADHFVYFGQLLAPYWGYGYSVPGVNDGMPFQVGLAPLCLALAGVLLVQPERKQKALVWFFAAMALGYGFLVITASGWLWQIVPMASLAQFPWRLLGVVSLAAALAAGCAYHSAWQQNRPLLALLIAIAVLASLPYAQPEHTPPSPRTENALAIMDFEMAHPDMVGLTAWVKEPPQDSPKLAHYLAGDTVPLAGSGIDGAVFEPLHNGAHRQVVRAQLPRAGTVTFFTYYYPGWHGYIDGQPVEIDSTGPQGIIAMQVPAGTHELSIIFTDTPLRTVAKWITLLSVAVWTLLTLRPATLVTGRRS